MLTPPEVPDHFDMSLPPFGLADSKAPFDGVAVFRFEPSTGAFFVSYASQLLAEMLDVGDICSLAPAKLQHHLGCQEDLTDLFTQLLSQAGEEPVSVQQSLISGNGSTVATYCSYSLLPLDLDGSSATSVAILLLVRDLSSPVAEKLITDQASVSNSIRLGSDLGTLCYQICRQLEFDLGVGYRCLLGVFAPNGELVPVVTGQTDSELLARLLTHVPSEIAADDLLELPLNAVGPAERATLSDYDVAALWLKRVSADPLASAETLVFGHSFDIGYAPTADDSFSGVLIVASPTGHPLPADSVTVVNDAEVLLGTALRQAYKITTESFESSHDLLTNLPNRDLVLDQLSDVLDRSDPELSNICVLLVDIDKFASINHNFGSDVGDDILREVADRLLASVRLGDQVGRVSSDQYMVICVNPQGELDPSSVAKRVLSSVNKPFKLGNGSELALTSSVGIVSVQDDDLTPSQILGQAEAALGSASGKGRGTFAVYSHGQDAEARERAEVEAALSNALANEELFIVYQPIVDISTKRMVGAEALIRWNRPDHGVVSPAVFVPIAEENGQIVPIGTWIIDQVCQDLAAWPEDEAGKPVISINLAAKQLDSDTLVPTVISALRRNNLHPSSLGFEITESMEIANLSVALQTLERLKELNCYISIDDFGIGHATMDYLRQFSMADTLKVDKSFVEGLSDSVEDAAIVTASVALAKALDMRVVAEGIETKNQLALLAELGCDFGQGFGFSKPVDLSEVQGLWLKSYLDGPSV